MKVYVKHNELKNYLIEEKLDGIQIIDNIHDANFIIDGSFKEEDYNPKLKGVIIPYTGHNRIDLDAMRNHHLMLFVTPTRSPFVAEKAVTLGLALLGNTVTYHNLLKEGNWSARNSDKRVPWVSMYGLKIGLFGYGRIGTKIHHLLKGFTNQFYTIDRNKVYPKDVKTVKNLTELVNVSDIIMISTPLNKTTKHIFDETLLSKMSDKYIVNVGRGQILKEKDLFDALKNKTLKGYASDVWYNYPRGKENVHPSSFPIYDLENVVLSNHSGGFTTKTNNLVNQDIVKTLYKLKKQNYEDRLDLTNLI